MRILFLPPSYLGLYKPIYEELKRQGNDVVCMVQEDLPSDPYHKIGNPLIRLFKFVLWKVNNVTKRYWVDVCKNEVFKTKFDLLFVIQGTNFNPYLLHFLKEKNPNLRSSLYIWDSNKMYNFMRNAKYFDKVYSFDLYDVNHARDKSVKFLPFYWSCESNERKQIKYVLSSIGTNHHGRLLIYRAVFLQMQMENQACFLRLVVSHKNKTFKDSLRMFKKRLLGLQTELDENKVNFGELSYPFVTSKKFTLSEYNDILLQSEAVLDTDNEKQFGTTPRLIWALAANKHVFTTNTNIIKFPFYDKSYIHIIDRNNPVIDLKVLKDNPSINARDNILYLRIDNWVKNFL